MRPIDPRPWIRDHLVASLLIVAGLGAVGQYAAGKFFSPPEAAARDGIAKNSRESMRALGRVIQGFIHNDQARIDAAIVDLDEASTRDIDPDAREFLVRTTPKLLAWRRTLRTPGSEMTGPSLGAVLEEADAIHAKLGEKYGGGYRASSAE